MSKIILLMILPLMILTQLNAQELYVFTEPASNMPAHSLSAKYNGKFLENMHTGSFGQRHTPELMFGVSKKLMIHITSSFSDMYSSNLRWESAKFYAKYRFLSNDDVHKHFRMAAFVTGAYSRNEPTYDDLSLDGDQSGVQLGVIATQLINKLAVSATVSNVQIFDDERWGIHAGHMPFQAIDYTFSAGYLILPFNYTSYNQTNLNFYVELLGQQTYDPGKYYVDLAPAIQLIFNSNTKLNIGYRFQLGSDMYRIAEKSWQVGLERTFLNALRKKKKA